MFGRLIYEFRKLFKKPFKIGMVTFSYSENKLKVNNGVAIYTGYLSRELANLGAEVHIFCNGEKNSLKREYIGEGKLVIHRIKTGLDINLKDKLASRYISNLSFNNKIIEKVTKENAREKLDVLNSHGGLITGVFLAKYFQNIRWVHTFHSLEKNRLKFMAPEEKKYFGFTNWIESAIFNADGLIALSKKIKSEIIQEYKIKEEKIFTIPNGVDPGLFNAEDTHKEKRVLYIGRFSLEKGIDFLPDIIKGVLLKDKEVKFEILAADKDSDVPDSLKNTVAELEKIQETFPKRFIWHREKVSRDEISKIYKKAMIYIQPSRYDTYPTTVLESMACGCAPIVTEAGGMPEVVGNTGLILPLKKGFFIKNILNLLEDYRLRERYVRRSLKIAEKHEWKKIAKRLLELYKIIGKFKDNEESNIAEALNGLEEFHKKNVWENENSENENNNHTGTIGKTNKRKI
jgi:alpha-maltose-1-phosphate synthase